MAPPPGKWTRTESGDVVSFDLGPRGLQPFKLFIAFWTIAVTVLALPLCVAGLAALTFDDFRPWEKALCAIPGAIGLVIIIAGYGWALGHAWFWRERIQVMPAGVITTSGLWPRLRTRKFEGRPPVAELDQETPWNKSHRWIAGARLRVGSETESVLLGLGLDNESREALQPELQESFERIDGTGELDEWRYPHGSGLSGLTKKLLEDLFGSIRRPLPFVLCDLAMIVVGFLTPVLVEYVDAAQWYPWCIVPYALGLVLRRFDDSYMDGMVHYDTRWFWFKIVYMTAGLLVGFAAAITMSQAWPSHLWVLCLTVPAAHAYLLFRMQKRARNVRRRPGEKQPPPSAPKRSLGASGLAALTLFPVAAIHEHATFLALADTSRNLFIFALPIVMPAIVAGYLPVRMHAFIDDPDDRSNRAWFWVTVFLMTLYAVFGVSLF